MKFNNWFLLLIIITTLIFSGCVSDPELNSEPKLANYADPALQTNNDINLIKLEIIHFHGTNQCYSCIEVGDLAEKTVNTYFKDELASGKITFAHLNGELFENQDLVKKYNVHSSSITLGQYFDDGTFNGEQNVTVWYKINDESEYLNYFKGVIEKKLKGE